MVQSGLVDDPRVSQFRLTAHLALAFAIFGAMLWLAMSLLEGAPARRASGPRGLAWAVVGLVSLMIVTGGFVAGIRAGFAYNTFPLMNGHIVPPEALLLTPWWKNLFYNMAMVQLDHRIAAYLLALAVPVLWLSVRWDPGATRRARIAAHLLLGMLAVQIGLGILTLLHVVPLALAALHQAGAVLVFAFSLNLAHAVRRI